MLFPEVEETKSLYNNYSNLLKRIYTLVNEDARVIDSNTLAEEKISLNLPNMITPLPADEDGFAQGLAAEVLEIIPDEDGGEYMAGVPEAAEPSVEELREQALFEIEKMKSEAQALLSNERHNVLEAAKRQGYEEGYAAAMQEFEAKKQQLENERRSLEQQYEEQLAVLEPQFVDTLTAIYEQIFGIELVDCKSIITHLISSAMRRIDGGRNLIVHVSREDYSYVNMHRKNLEEGMPAGSFEVVEDITLSQNEALVETDSGIVDCSLGTQLAELNKKLRLLSFVKPVEE